MVEKIIAFSMDNGKLINFFLLCFSLQRSRVCGVLLSGWFVCPDF
jgi:hypothetical protein